MQRFTLTLMMSWLVVGVAMASPDKSSPYAADVSADTVDGVALRGRALAPVAPASPEVNLMEVSDDLVQEWVRVDGVEVAAERWRQLVERTGAE